MESHTLRSLRRLTGLLIASSATGRLQAQTAEQLRAFHDQATAVIAHLASRPLTPGDTFLTFNPDPGGLFHTVHVTTTSVESSLLRADRMMGTAHVEWSGNAVSRFEVIWTRADTLRGSKIDSAIAVRGEVVGDSIRLSSPATETLAIPRAPWAVVDFGMGEQLIPIFRSLLPNQPAQLVVVLRPYHLRWDTVSVSVRDSAGLRLATTIGQDKTREAWVIDTNGNLLYVRRTDQPGDRIPLPMSVRYQAMQQYITTIRALLAPFPAAPAKTP